MTRTVTLPLADTLPPLHVRVDFGSGVPGSQQGPALLAFERFLREHGVAAQVFKATMADDLKRRRDMTPEQRSKL